MSALLVAFVLVAQPGDVNEAPAGTRGASGWFVGLNPLAAVVPYVREYDVLAQLVTGTEVGLALSGGYQFSRRHALEARLSLGLPNALQFQTQASLSWKLFPFDIQGLPRGGFFVAPNLRVGHIVSIPNQIGWLNVVPSVDIGWVQTFGRVYLNARLTQSLIAVTASSNPRILPAVALALSPDPALTPVLPVFSMDVGWQF